MKLKPTVKDWIRPALYQTTAYPFVDPGQAIKLDAMENPYTWDAEITEQWLDSLRTVALNRYPDAKAREIKQQLRATLQIPDAMAMILGNGSDELIQMLLLAFNGPQRVVLVPEPSFIMYRILAQVVGMEYVGIPLQAEQFELNKAAFLTAIAVHRPALIFLAYPNNPTGNCFNLADIEAIIEATPGIVVLDEAYAPFSEETWMPRLGEYPNVLITRTVSKLGLAGLRLGVLVGSGDWLEHIEKTRQPYNVNVLSQLTATFALQRYALFENQIQRIKIDRALLWEQLNALPTVTVWPSQTNFILFRVPQSPKVFEALKAHGVLVKCVHGRHPLLEDCLQVTVGTPAENQTFLESLTQII